MTERKTINISSGLHINKMALIVKSQIKEVAKMNISSDFAPALEEKVKKLIEEAVARAEANGRRTLMSKDL